MKLMSAPAWDIKLGIQEPSKCNVPDLLEPRRSCDLALCAAIMTGCIKGTSTRKVDDLVKGRGFVSGGSNNDAPDLRLHR